MSFVALAGNPSGTGTLTVSAPNTNSNRALALPDASGTLALLESTVGGVSRTWQNLIGSRTASTIYTNTTGYPIMVSIGLASAAGAWNPQLLVGGVVVAQTGAVSNIGMYGMVSAVVPAGATYQIASNGANVIIWAELR